VTVHVPFAIGNHTHLWALDAVKLALRQDGIQPQLHFLGQDDSYYHLLAGLWRKRRGFVLVEHDIVVWPGAIQQLEECPEPWCLYPYYASVGWCRDALGCTKFSASLLKQYPDCLTEPFPTCCNHTKYWCGLDRLIAHRLKGYGLEPHLHSPAVVNLNDRWT
jgi:hypothetical protein